MWHHHPFSQRNRKTKRTVGVGLEVTRKWGGGGWTKFEKGWRVGNVRVLLKSPPPPYITAIFEKSHPSPFFKGEGFGLCIITVIIILITILILSQNWVESVHKFYCFTVTLTFTLILELTTPNLLPNYCYYLYFHHIHQINDFWQCSVFIL